MELDAAPGAFATLKSIQAGDVFSREGTARFHFCRAPCRAVFRGPKACPFSPFFSLAKVSMRLVPFSGSSLRRFLTGGRIRLLDPLAYLVSVAKIGLLLPFFIFLRMQGLPLPLSLPGFVFVGMVPLLSSRARLSLAFFRRDQLSWFLQTQTLPLPPLSLVLCSPLLIEKPPFLGILASFPLPLLGRHRHEKFIESRQRRSCQGLGVMA